MQKRRGGRQHCDRLPLTGQDLSPTQARPTQARTTAIGRRRKKTPINERHILGCSVAIGLFIFVILFFAKADSTTGQLQQPVEQDDRFRRLPLLEYKSLQYAFSHSRLVGLYFAAAWLPESTFVTKSIEEYLGPKMLPPSSPGIPPPSDRALFSLVYISSDRSEADFHGYKGKNWMAVPFHSAERNKLKQYFRICSTPEVELLGIDRKSEIPTLLIMDGETHQLITASGADDLEEYGGNALNHWVDLQNLILAMEDKYGEGNEPKPQRHIYHHADSVSSLFA